MLLARLSSLPDTSALSAAVQQTPRGWGGDRHALVTVIDAIQQNSWVTAASASKRKPKKPTPMPRPKAPRKTVTIAQLMQAKAEAEGV